MRRYIYLLLAFVARTALASSMGADDARHLLNRTTFGGDGLCRRRNAYIDLAPGADA